MSNYFKCVSALIKQLQVPFNSGSEVEVFSEILAFELLISVSSKIINTIY